MDFLYKHIVYQISGLKITHAVYAYPLYMYLYLQYMTKNRKHHCKGGHHNVSFLKYIQTQKVDRFVMATKHMKYSRVDFFTKAYFLHFAHKVSPS